MNEQEPLHTGDDDRLDLLTSVRTAVESIRDDPAMGDIEVAEVVEGALSDLDKLDTLIIDTIRREQQ